MSDRGPSESGRRQGLRRAPMSGDVVPSRPRRQPREIDELPSEEDVERFSNVTRTCPECRKEVFDDAAVCYHCGNAFEGTTEGTTKASRWVVVTVVLILIAFVVIYSRGWW